MFGRTNTPAAARKEPTPFEIGLNGTADELRHANEKAGNRKDQKGAHIGDWDQRDLQRGAILAFQEGRPENLQTILANPSEFDVKSSQCTEKMNCEKILLDLIKGSDNATFIIMLALAKVPTGQEKQDYLNRHLYYSVCDEYKGRGEDLVAAYLKAGADANAELGYNKAKGATLARAVDNNWPQPVIELLCKHGANFDDSLQLMEANSWHPDAIKNLNDVRQKVTAAFNAAASAAPPPVPEPASVPPVLSDEVLSAISAVKRKPARPQ